MEKRVKENSRAKGYKKPQTKEGVVKNPSGRGKGSLNVYSYDIKKRLADGADEKFMANLFKDIEETESKSDRAKLRMEVIKLLVPKPKDPEEAEKDNQIRDKLLQVLFLK